MRDVLDPSIGEVLRQAGKLSAEQVDQVATYQREHGLRFGEAAVALRLAVDEDVLWALSKQFQYPYLPLPESGVLRGLALTSDPLGAQAESFRELRSQLMMTTLAHKPRPALAVVSPDAGDGKTFFATNIAAALSQLGARTLLVDANMRTAHSPKLLNTSPGLGLSSVLAGRSKSSEIQQVEGLPSLFVLPSGAVPPNPLELLLRPVFALLLEELKAAFDYVLVDTPAAESGADGRVVAAAAGASVVIGRRGTTRMRSIRALVDAIGKSPVRLAGIVLNDY